MRYLSKWGRYGVQVRPQLVEAYANGLIRILQEPIYAIFEPHATRPEERDMAVAYFTFEGYYQEQDEATVFPPDHRIGVYDTEQAQLDGGWSDEVRLEVEAELRRIAERFNYLLEVPATFVAPPWPRYEDYKGTPAALVRKLVDEGYDIYEVMEYERATLNREPVIEALQAALDAPVQEEEVVG